jgi:hypothetical protein
MSSDTPSPHLKFCQSLCKEINGKIPGLGLHATFHNYDNATYIKYGNSIIAGGWLKYTRINLLENMLRKTKALVEKDRYQNNSLLHRLVDVLNKELKK